MVVRPKGSQTRLPGRTAWGGYVCQDGLRKSVSGTVIGLPISWGGGSPSCQSTLSCLGFVNLPIEGAPLFRPPIPPKPPVLWWRKSSRTQGAILRV